MNINNIDWYWVSTICLIANIMLCICLLSPNICYWIHKQWFEWKPIGSKKRVRVTHEELIKIGFKHNPTLLVNDYSYDISLFGSDYKKIDIMLNPGNVYVYIREGHIDDDRTNDNIVCIYNEDMHGILTAQWVRKLVSVCKLIN